MELAELSKVLVEHNKSGKGYQIHFNSGNFDEKDNINTDVEFGDLYFSDLYFSDCCILNEQSHPLNEAVLCLSNSKRKPLGKKKDGTKLYPMEINSHMFLDFCKIERIEELTDPKDWFEYPSERVINIYMIPEIMNGCRNVVTVGFMS